MEQQKLSGSRFGDAAERYLNSAVHAKGQDLERLSKLVRGPIRALDLGCGAGHASFALASNGAHVTAPIKCSKSSRGRRQGEILE